MSPPSDTIGHRPTLATHRVLGAGRGAALLRPDGTVDWWCPDRFDATPLCFSLLDRAGPAGRWCDARAVWWDERPAGPTAHTVVRIDGRRLRLWDGLVADGAGSVLVRLVRLDGSSGATEPRNPRAIAHHLRLGGFDEPTDDEHGTARWREIDGATASAAGATVRALDNATTQVAGTELRCRVEPHNDSWAGFVVCSPGVAEVGGWDVDRAVAALAAAEHADARSMRAIRLPHHHPERVTDALSVLHALTDDESGAPVASVTTSLPEAIGGPRQFDYRYSWLRDSAAAVATASLLGHPRAAHAYIGFLHELRMRRPGTPAPLTTARGTTAPAERTVAGVAGWAASGPVRTGNAARDQLQLDSVATVLEALWIHVTNGGERRDLWPLVDWLAGHIAAAPVGATSGIWELRSPRLLVTDELARWIGLRYAVRLRRVLRPWVRRATWITTRDQAGRRVAAAWDPVRGLLPQSVGPSTPDAATLLAAIHECFGPDDPRAGRLVRSTIAALEEGPFLRRYPSGTDDFAGVEATFVPASWWAISALCAIGDLPAAEARADAMCARLPRLLPEEWDVVAEHGLGNAPLLWSHSQAARALYDLHALRIRRRFGRLGHATWRIGRFLRLRFSR